MIDEITFKSLATAIHSENVAVGWWTNIETGESTLHTRNRPEMLMLAISEIVEAAEGIEGALDDKLTDLPMYDVELADFAIRQFDQIGAEIACGQQCDWNKKFNGTHYIKKIRAASRCDRLMFLVVMVAEAMEDYRKGRNQEYVEAMIFGIKLVFLIAEVEGIDLLDIIARKRMFNATRADHKIENRLKADGKAF